MRTSGRAIMFDATRRRILVERYRGQRQAYSAFPGGMIEPGETLEECLSRELVEEVGARIVDLEFLFLAENFFSYEGEPIHSIELFCEVKLESDEVESQLAGHEFPWMEVATLGEVDLRPTEVRDRIIDGTYRHLRHLVIGRAPAPEGCQVPTASSHSSSI
jgi:ADP-ribose pyrophosphatase YjhB (NUDIX family)